VLFQTTLISYKILLFQLERHGFDGWTVQRISTWPDGHIQKVVVNRSVSRWRSVTSGVPQGPCTGTKAVFINDTDSRIECTLSKFADNTNLCGVTDAHKGQDVTLRDLDKLEKWAFVQLRRFNKGQVQGPAPGLGQHLVSIQARG